MTDALTRLPDTRNAPLPPSYQSARDAIIRCEHLDECKGWSDKMLALASYGRQANDDTLRKTAERIQAHAIQRAGQLLKSIKPGKPGPDKSIGAHPQNSPPRSRSAAAKRAGFSVDQKNQALRVASIPPEEFTALVEADEPATVTELAERGAKKKPRPLVDLQGRDPAEFALSTHAQGDIGRMADRARNTHPAAVARGALVAEHRRIRADAELIVGWLSELVGHLEAL